MLRFFRHIRKNLMEQLHAGQAGNKVRTYILYAIGEILLVVIGILIALQVNNWNEDRKKVSVKETLIESLIVDLEQDGTQLARAIEVHQRYLDNRLKLKEILEREQATVDTLESILSKQEIISTESRVKYNRSAFESIYSTGNAELFDPELLRRISELHELQDTQLEYNDGNMDAYVAMVTKFLDVYPYTGGLLQKGPLYEQYLNNYDETDLVQSFNVISHWGYMVHGANHFSYNLILPRTVEILKDLRTLKQSM